MSDQAVIALLGIFGSIVAGFFKLVHDQTKAHTKVAEAVDNLKDATVDQTKAMQKVADNTKRSADAQVRAAKESKERNGHLGEQNLQITKLVQETHRDMIANLENIQEQHVKKQIVDKQQVKSEVVEHQEVKE